MYYCIAFWTIVGYVGMLLVSQIVYLIAYILIYS